MIILGCAARCCAILEIHSMQTFTCLPVATATAACLTDDTAGRQCCNVLLNMYQVNLGFVRCLQQLLLLY